MQYPARDALAIWIGQSRLTIYGRSGITKGRLLSGEKPTLSGAEFGGHGSLFAVVIPWMSPILPETLGYVPGFGVPMVLEERCRGREFESGLHQAYSWNYCANTWWQDGRNPLVSFFGGENFCSCVVPSLQLSTHG